MKYGVGPIQRESLIKTEQIKALERKDLTTLYKKAPVPARKLHGATVPKKYMKDKLFSLILRGLFDTDGSVTIFNNNGILYPRIEIKICPSPAQKQIIEILDRLNLRYKIQKFLDIFLIF